MTSDNQNRNRHLRVLFLVSSLMLGVALVAVPSASAIGQVEAGIKTTSGSTEVFVNNVSCVLKYSGDVISESCST